MKKAFLMMVLALMACIFAGCAKDDASATEGAADKPLVVATEATFPPYEFMVGQEIVGIDIDICKAVAEKLGRPLKVENTAFDSIITHVITKKADVGASGITVTEERKMNVLFSKPYFTASQVIIVMANNAKIQKSADLKGVRIGCQQGTTGYDYVAQNIVTQKGSDLLQAFPNAALAVEALMSGKLDAVVIDEGPAQTFAKHNAGKIVILPEALTKEEYAIALNKKDTELCKVFDEVITDLISSGKLEEITKKNKELADKQNEKK